MTQLPHSLEALGLDRRFTVDVLSVARSVRRIGLLHAPLSSESGLREIFAGVGLTVFSRRELVRQDDPDSREGILRDPAGGEVVNFIELWYARPGEDVLPSPRALFADPGKHLGYPQCCVAEWERLKSQRDLYRRYIFETVGGNWEVNRLASLFQTGLLIPDFFPCSLSCRAAREFAAPIVDLAREILDPAWVRDTMGWMQAPLIQFGGSVYAFPTWTFNGRELELNTANAAHVSLAAVGRFDDEEPPGCRLLSFRHLAGAEQVNLIGADGVRAVVQIGGGSDGSRLWRRLREWWPRRFRCGSDKPPDQIYPLW